MDFETNNLYAKRTNLEVNIAVLAYKRFWSVKEIDFKGKVVYI